MTTVSAAMQIKSNIIFKSNPVTQYFKIYTFKNEEISMAYNFIKITMNNFIEFK